MGSRGDWTSGLRRGERLYLGPPTSLRMRVCELHDGPVGQSKVVEDDALAELPLPYHPLMRRQTSNSSTASARFYSTSLTARTSASRLPCSLGTSRDSAHR